MPIAEAVEEMSARALSRKTFVVALVATAIPSAIEAMGPAPFVDLAELWRHRSTIARVRIFSLDGDISTMIALSPEALESFSGVRKRKLTKRGEIGAVIDALRKAKPVTDPAPFDARFGLVFEDRSGTRRYSAFTNDAASHGTIGQRSVAFDDPAPLLAALRRASR